MFRSCPTPLRAVALLSILSSLAIAQTQVGRLQVLVAPDRPDWKYSVGENAAFIVRVVRNGDTVAGLKVTYSVGPEMMEPPVIKTVTAERDGLRVEGGTMKSPGFLRCIATVEADGHTYRGLGTAAFEPEKIEPVVRNPEDFDAFWQKGKDDLARIPVDAERRLLPEFSTASVNVYEVSIQNAGVAGGPNTRIFGILCEPKAAGKYPAVLGVPGAGVHQIRGLIKLAEQGAITLNIGIHGIPVTMDAKVVCGAGRRGLERILELRTRLA